ncbi:hypothetical protein MBM_05896 [Drepanopeziza brunnea f. sp. 'multigermtubi' MB_m1]|uniref:Uncharacterized protein n=1 Tax=Marssonina brunnea f. sp. multigermtubi (strain MB_m1) TaxID=1072389 RepID=K1WEJ9_MARBU|nr:uncharacterized protein MBM_05896 [Drepanopeziza brunnea f. sp. 'multigermtubi' MB_m1]EKD15885.1 hypothetical protein MBM_05896 [Drepanopeziza brunnea f. sp. 'multigermtubi' MB_m1]
MSRLAIRPRAEVCQLCDFIKTRNVRPFSRLGQTSRNTIGSPLPFSTEKRSLSQKTRSLAPPTAAVKLPLRSRDSGTIALDAQLEKRLQDVKAMCNTLLMQDKVPSERDVLIVLQRCKALASILVSDQSPSSFEKKAGATSALLSLDDLGAKKVSVHKPPATTQRLVDQLSSITYSVIKFPPVFVTPSILELYVAIQSDLGKPETFPEVLNLYANKPLPEEGTFPIRYKKQNPNKAANAVPLQAADQALQTAINAKQLVVAMDIIEASYTTKAAHRAKFVRHALLPTTILGLAPAAAWIGASQLATFQTTMDTAMATQVAFVGILAYVGFTATVGVVAVTTANDQMDRVTWAPGVPLRQRWIREEERAAIDKVAGAWGFREIWRRGEEEGADWDALREWAGRKSMILDSVQLMEGME